jgi:hypothetical protein
VIGDILPDRQPTPWSSVSFTLDVVIHQPIERQSLHTRLIGTGPARRLGRRLSHGPPLTEAAALRQSRPPPV